MSRMKSQFTQYAIDARKTAGLTQPEAADILGCSVNTLQKYESNAIRMHDDIAARMALVYRDPRLTRYYCENECAIGCKETHCECDQAVEVLMLRIAVMDRDELMNLVRVAQRITEDGVIDDDEVDDCTQCIDTCDRLEKKFGALKLRLQHMCAVSGH